MNQVNIDVPRLEMYMGHLAPITAIAFSPDGRTLASGDTERRVLVRRAGGSPVQLDLRSADEKVRTTERMRSLAISSDGMTLFVSASDKLEAIRLDTMETYWSYAPGRFLGFLVVSPLRIALGKQGRLAVCFENGSIGVWESDGRFAALWRDREQPTHIGWLSGEDRLVGISKWQLYVWDPSHRRRVAASHLTDDDPLHGLSVHPSEPLALVRTLHRLRLVNLETMEMLFDEKAPVGLPIAAIQPGTGAIAIANEHRVQLMDLSGRWIDELDLIDARVTCVSWSPDGSQLAVGSSDLAVRVFQMIG